MIVCASQFSLRRALCLAGLFLGVLAACTSATAAAIEPPSAEVVEYCKARVFEIGVLRFVLFGIASLVVSFLTHWVIAKSLNSFQGTALNTLKLWVYALLLLICAVIAVMIASTFGSLVTWIVILGSLGAGFSIIMKTYAIEFQKALLWFVVTTVAIWIANLFIEPAILGEEGSELVAMSGEDLAEKAKKFKESKEQKEKPSEPGPVDSLTQPPPVAGPAPAEPQTSGSGATPVFPTLQAQYEALTAQRAKLDPNDKEAVARFNKAALDYNEAKNRAARKRK